MSRSAAPIVWCLLAAALFGASTPAAKALLSAIDPFPLAGLLYLGAALAVLPFALRHRVRLDGRNALLLAGAVLFGGIAGPVLLMLGLSVAPASSVALWLNLETPATVLFATLVFREHVGGRTLLAVVLVMGASTLLAAPFDAGSVSAALLLAGACLCWGIDNNVTALIDGVTPSQTTLVKGLVAGTTNLGIGLASGSVLGDAGSVGGALGVGALSYGASLVLYVAGAQQLGATRSQALFASAPLWGLLVAWFWLGEPVLGLQLVAAALTAAAVVLVHTERHTHDHAHVALRHTHWHRHDDGHHDHDHDGLPAQTWHCHDHAHGAVRHAHAHTPDVHHRHEHRS